MMMTALKFLSDISNISVILVMTSINDLFFNKFEIFLDLGKTSNFFFFYCCSDIWSIMRLWIFFKTSVLASLLRHPAGGTWFQNSHVSWKSRIPIQR